MAHCKQQRVHEVRTTSGSERMGCTSLLAHHRRQQAHGVHRSAARRRARALLVQHALDTGVGRALQ